MAERARLIPTPPTPREQWPYHKLNARAVPVATVLGGERRMEADTYLAPGFAIRQAIESKRAGWGHLGRIANVWMPNRLKGIQVDGRLGTPFFAATQVFDIRPTARKWLAIKRTPNVKQRYVERGQILVTCSGSVGRPTIAYGIHENVLISHDLLRVDATRPDRKGWIYAYLHTSQARAMATSAHYGHIIKHLETSHLEALPIPNIDDATAARLNEQTRRIVELRDDAHRLTLEAEARFTKAVGPLDVTNWGEAGFSVKASGAFTTGRRRLEATYHQPAGAAIRKHLAKKGKEFCTIRDTGFALWVPGRYKRIPADNGVIYRDSQDLLQVNPDLPKRFADSKFGDKYRGRVQEGWILVPSSGQVYGIVGTPVLATGALSNQVVSNHVIRIKPPKSPTVLTGYLLTALAHPVFGRPLVKALPFGSSVPEIEVEDLAAFPFVRLGTAEEAKIADLAERSADARAQADKIEQSIAAEAGQIIEDFIKAKDSFSSR